MKHNVNIEFEEIRRESTSETLERSSIKSGKVLSKFETVKFYALLDEISPEKRAHLERIAKPIKNVKEPRKQYNLFKELGF